MVMMMIDILMMIMMMTRMKMMMIPYLCKIICRLTGCVSCTYDLPTSSLCCQVVHWWSILANWDSTGSDIVMGT